MHTTTLFVEQMTTIDFAYLDAERGLLGESWIVDIELTGKLDNQGMIFDFSDVKHTLKAWIDQCVDHQLLIPENMSGVHVATLQEQVTVTATFGENYQFYHQSPSRAVCLIPSETITTESVTAFLKKVLVHNLPDNVIDFSLVLRPEAIDGAYYHYAHGLKKHAGNCQRIAHGHRSRIVIERNAGRDQALEEKWAKRWQDIYLITEQDIDARFAINGEPYYHVAYHAMQGDFVLKLPQAVCELLPTDSTVELIADFIARVLKAQYPNDHICVKAFEGVHKGAIAVQA